ncbi:CsbD family protein [Streptomyces sp. NPDC006551]|uniref:CsbD family protein n=1 Tax=Streptomyces sp. NPDC006551 TaxID=3157178 RepID=UPI0033A31723
MSKAKGKAQEMKGKMKKGVGDTVDDRGMQAEGRREETTGKAKSKAAEAMRRIKKHGHE